MADLTAQLQLQFGIAPTLRTFTLEVDQRDVDLNRPVSVKPYSMVNWLFPEDQIDNPSEFDNHDILVPIANGYTHVRLYSPLDIPVQLIATEPPIPLEVVVPAGIVHLPIGAGIIGSGTKYFRPKTIEVPTNNPFAPRVIPQLIWVQEELEVVRGLGTYNPEVFVPEWEYVGVREATVMETIQFEFERFKFLRYNYATGIEPMFASEFLNARNELVDPPQFRPDLGGVLLANQDVVGALLIRYNIPYRLYKINYSLPHGRQYPALQRAWLSGDITRTVIPPVIVVAMSDQNLRIARVDFQKNVFPNGAFLSVWTQGTTTTTPPQVPNTLNERNRNVETIRIYDPNNPESYIDVERAKAMEFADTNGAPRYFNFNPGS